MATVKNFGLAGVAANVQFSKGGGKIDWDGSKFNLTDASGTQVDLLVPLVPTVDADAASKQYVDSVATGLDVKNSVRLATTAAFTTGTPVYAAGVSEGQGTWSGFGTSLLVDGVTVANGDRILVKNESGTDQEGHGIWVVSGVGSAITLARSTDADNTPNNEVSGGMFTFVEEGSQADSGWVMSSPNGIAVVDTASADNLIFSQFSGSSSFTGGDGIDITASVISVDTSGTADTAITTSDVMTFFDGGASGPLQRRAWSVILTDLDILTDAAGGNALTASEGITLTGNNLTLTIPGLTDGAETLVLADSFAVFDGTATLEYTFSDLVDDLDIPHGSALNATGGVYRIATDDGGNDYTVRTITASVVARDEGISIVDGDGVSGNPTIGVDIVGLTANGTNMDATDNFIVDNGTNNRKITGQEVADGVSTLLSLDSTRIDAGDTFTFVDTDATVNSVTIGVEDFDTTGSLAIAEFKANATAQDLCGFVFTNGTDEVRIETQGQTNCDIRLVPGGTGSVLIGDAGAAVIQGDDGTDLTVKGGDASVPTDAGDLILEGGDGSTTLADGDVLIRPGNGATASTGKVCIQDEDEEDIACFFGTTGTDVNFFQFTSAITGVGPTLTSEGEANVDLIITAKGTGQIVLDGTTWPDAGVALDSILATNTANILTAVTSADDADRVLQHTQGGNIEWVLVSSVGGNSFENWATDSGTIVADSTSDTASLLGGDGVVTSGDASTDTITIDLALGELSTETTVDPNADFLIFSDAGVTNKKILVESLFDNQDVPHNITANGLITRTAADTYASRTIVKSAVATEEGIIVNDGDGVANNPAIGLDIQGLTPDSSVVGTDQLVVFNGTNNVKVLVSDIVSGGTLAFRDVASDTGGPAVADSSADTLSLLGGAGTGVLTTGEAGTDTITFSLDIDSNLVQAGEDLAATDELAFFNASAGAGDISAITGQQLADGVSTLLSLDNTRITDSDDTFVDTNEVVGAVTINTDDAGGTTTQLLATFKAASGSVVTDANFLFTNEDSVDTGGNDEIQICAAGAATDIDVRIKPKGAGEVILGDTASNATLSASDGTTGFDLTLNGGDGSAGDGGDVIITPGTGTGADGKVCITDDDSVNVTCFEGVDTAVNNFVMTNAVTAKGPILEVEGSDTNIDMEFLPKGTGVLAIDTDVISATTYRDNLTDDSNDIPNTAYVAEQVAATLSGGVSSFKFTVNLDNNGNLDPASSTIPANATVLRVSINVTASDAAATLTIGTTSGGAEYADASTNDPSATGLFNVDLQSLTVGALRAVVASTNSDGGSATVVVEYKND